MDKPVKCACASCQCLVPSGKGVTRDGAVYCSRTCAYDCTALTCLCVHDRCDPRTAHDRRA
ncbi:MAG TPA: metallothionein [Tepidisphaeraceae bacterium]|nr:metallothionein [Tepidisphaeraceae bacterium]